MEGSFSSMAILHGQKKQYTAHNFLTELIIYVHSYELLYEKDLIKRVFAEENDPKSDWHWPLKAQN